MTTMEETVEVIAGLPRVAKEPSNLWIDQKFLMIGQGKIGKSDFWSRGKRTFFFECEPGLNHLKCMRMPCRSWEDIRDIAGRMYKVNEEGGMPYDTLVIDTIDMFCNRAGDEIVDQAKVKYSSEVASQIHSIGDIPNGAGWYKHKKLIENTMNELAKFPCAVVLIGHVVDKEIQTPTRKHMRSTINIGGQVGNSILHWADHTIHMRAKYTGEKIERCFRTIPSDTIDAGSRGNIIPDGFEITNDMEESYNRFRKLFT
jgi:hypothetical protein